MTHGSTYFLKTRTIQQVERAEKQGPQYQKHAGSGLNNAIAEYNRLLISEHTKEAKLKHQKQLEEASKKRMSRISKVDIEPKYEPPELEFD